MRVLIATDAWHPQVNGVVRTLTSLAEAARGLGVTIDFLTPEGFASVPLPTYSGLRLAITNGAEIARRIERGQNTVLKSLFGGPFCSEGVEKCLQRHRLDRRVPPHTRRIALLPERLLSHRRPCLIVGPVTIIGGA